MALMVVEPRKSPTHVNGVMYAGQSIDIDIILHTVYISMGQSSDVYVQCDDGRR